VIPSERGEVTSQFIWYALTLSTQRVASLKSTSSRGRDGYGRATQGTCATSAGYWCDRGGNACSCNAAEV
jgi:hypothetical protein